MLLYSSISTGHVEQWGAVKHKKDKKLPAVGRERERERDGQGHHTSLRGASSPRGRGRGGGRGAGPHSGGYRQQRDRTTNGSSSAAAPASSTNDSAWPANGQHASTHDATAPTDTPNVDAGEDASGTPTANPPEDEPAPTEDKHEASIEPSAPSDASKQTPAAAPSKPRPKPGSTGLSWAQIAKYVQQSIPSPLHLLTNTCRPVIKPPPAPVRQTAPPVEPTPSAPQENIPETPEPTREEPTTVEAPTWDDEPAPTQPPPASQATPEKSTDGWVDANPSSAKSDVDSWTDLGSIQKSESWKQPTEPPATTTQPQEPAPPSQQETVVTPQIQQPTPDTFSPPPGLANPALSSPQPPKPSTPSNSRPAFGIHRSSARFKTDQAVIMPSQSPSSVGGYAIAKTLPLQFGSLDLSGDDNESQPSVECLFESVHISDLFPELWVKLHPTNRQWSNKN